MLGSTYALAACSDTSSSPSRLVWPSRQALRRGWMPDHHDISVSRLMGCGTKQGSNKKKDKFLALIAGYLYIYTCSLSQFYLSIAIILVSTDLWPIFFENGSAAAYLVWRDRYRPGRVFRSVTIVPEGSLRVHCSSDISSPRSRPWKCGAVLTALPRKSISSS